MCFSLANKGRTFQIICNYTYSCQRLREEFETLTLNPLEIHIFRLMKERRALLPATRVEVRYL
jgi:hypothetical protein